MKIPQKLLAPFSKWSNILILILGFFLIISPLLSDTGLYNGIFYVAMGLNGIAGIWLEKGSRLHNIITWVFLGVMTVTITISIILAFTQN